MSDVQVTITDGGENIDAVILTNEQALSAGITPAIFIGPQGPQGLTGPQGPQGQQGEKGDPGDVSTVNGVEPDAQGNVALTAADIPISSASGAASVAAALGGLSFAVDPEDNGLNITYESEVG